MKPVAVPKTLPLTAGLSIRDCTEGCVMFMTGGGMPFSIVDAIHVIEV